MRTEMQQVAGLARKALPEAGDPSVDYLQTQFNEDGGARDRSGKSDLYYTVFAVEGLLALADSPPLKRVVSYLRGFGDGGSLDLVHQACLGRCWASMPPGSFDDDRRARLLRHIESRRSADGGYNPQRGTERGTAYHCFLALGAYQDLQAAIPNPGGLARCLSELRTDDGAYANERGMAFGTTTATAAAVTLLRHLDIPVPPAVGEWLIARCVPHGGFLAMPRAPFPDLLSTATALHALAGMNVPLEMIRNSCIEFVKALWTGNGFRGHWLEDAADCEYTYYALLALGHLSI